MNGRVLTAGIERWRVGLATLGVGLFVATLCVSSAVWPAVGAERGETTALAWYWFGSAVGWLGVSAIAWRLCRVNPAWDRGRAAVWAILTVAVAARLVVIVATDPRLSDDVWRYIHDGRTLLAGDNPYRLAPADAMAGTTGATPHDAPAEALLSRINHPHLVTIYQPASQYVFAVLAAVDRGVGAMLGATAGEAPDAAARRAACVFRFGFAAVDVAIVALLLLALRGAERSPWWAALYAWHPLAISEVAASGHQDVLGILPLIGALVFASPSRDAGRAVHARRAATCAACLAIAVAVKPIVLPLALPLFLAWRGQRRAALAFVASLVVLLTLLITPFLVMPGGIAGMLETGRVFAETWSFNGSLHAAAWSLVQDKTWADRLMAGIAGVVLLACLWRRIGPRTTASAWLFALVLCSSTVHPWYLLWVLALVPIQFDPAAWLLSLTIGWSYVAHLHPDFAVPPAVRWIEYLPVYVVLTWALCTRAIRAGQGPDDRAASTGTTGPDR